MPFTGGGSDPSKLPLNYQVAQLASNVNRTVGSGTNANTWYLIPNWSLTAPKTGTYQIDVTAGTKIDPSGLAISNDLTFILGVFINNLAFTNAQFIVNTYPSNAGVKELMNSAHFSAITVLSQGDIITIKELFHSVEASLYTIYADSSIINAQTASWMSLRLLTTATTYA